MPASTASHASTTRLENLDFGSGTAAFELDGRPVILSGDAHAPSMAALREFYEPALADCYERVASVRRPTLFGRVRSWIGGLMHRLAGGRPRPAAAVFREAPEPGSGAGAPSRRGAPAKSAGANPAARESAEPARPQERRPGPPPALMTVFADPKGVHVTWHLGAPKGLQGPKAEPPKLTLTYALDSEIARRLQDCYRQLATLGYTVAGLDSLGPEAGRHAALPAEAWAKAEAAAMAPKAQPRPAAPPQAAADSREPRPSPAAALPEATAAKLRRLKAAAARPAPALPDPPAAAQGKVLPPPTTPEP